MWGMLNDIINRNSNFRQHSFIYHRSRSETSTLAKYNLSGERQVMQKHHVSFNTTQTETSCYVPHNSDRNILLRSTQLRQKHHVMFKTTQTDTSCRVQDNSDRNILFKTTQTDASRSRQLRQKHHVQDNSDKHIMPCSRQLRHILSCSWHSDWRLKDRLYCTSVFPTSARSLSTKSPALDWEHC